METFPELEGLNAEQRRFYRLIEERELEGDGAQKIELACGHTTIQIIPVPDSLQYMQCVQCIHDYVEGVRSTAPPNDGL
jgi:hypothetical protein